MSDPRESSEVFPSRWLQRVDHDRQAVVTCMDPRLKIHDALGIEIDRAFILRNGGGRVTDDVIRSLLMCTRILEVTNIGVLHHTDCRLQEYSAEELKSRTGADIDFLCISDPILSISDDIRLLRNSGLFGAGVEIWGALYVIDTHTVELVEPPLVSSRPGLGSHRS